MTQEERKWIIGAIVSCKPLVIFKHEQDKLDELMAKYLDPNDNISKKEFLEDLMYLEKIYG